MNILRRRQRVPQPTRDRKSTRLNSSHGYISYAVFCLKKKKKILSHNENEKNNNMLNKPYDVYSVDCHVYDLSASLVIPACSNASANDMLACEIEQHV